MESPPAVLTPFQIAVATLFFSLPESDGFLLAGGAALENAAAKRGWAIRRIHDSDTFCRLMIAGADNLLVDLALDSPPNLPPAASLAGPTFGLEELAGRKLLASSTAPRPATSPTSSFSRSATLSTSFSKPRHRSTPASIRRSWRRCSALLRDSTTATSRSPPTSLQSCAGSSTTGNSDYSRDQPARTRPDVSLLRIPVVLRPGNAGAGRLGQSIVRCTDAMIARSALAAHDVNVRSHNPWQQRARLHHRYGASATASPPERIATSRWDPG